MKKFIKKLFLIALAVFAVLFVLSLFGKNKNDASSKVSTPNPTPAPISISTKFRNFYMGFTPFPPDFTLEAINGAYKFMGDHGDIIAHHLDGGIPWQEAFDQKDFSKHLNENWKTRKSKTPSGSKVYLAITPISIGRDSLAPYWGETDNMSLTAPWNSYRFNDEHVKTAYLNYAIRAIDYFKPDYFATGIESNILISKDFSKWPDYLELNEYIYKELKKRYPKLIIFNTIQYEHLRAIENDSKANGYLQVPEVRKLMANSDIFAISTYHFGVDHNKPNPNYFDVALSFNKPIAVAESGAMSKDITVYSYKIKANEQDQSDFVKFILDEANKNKFLFVINFVNTDYDKLLDKLEGDAKEFGKAWVSTGLRRADGQDKPALFVWDAYYNLPKK